MIGTREVSVQNPAMTKNVKLQSKAVIHHELLIAQALAGNDKILRDRALRNLKKWFRHRSKNIPFTEDDFQRIWKGLFYSMWMSDKPLLQEECAENIASLLHELPIDQSFLLFKHGLMTLMNEWFGIDQLRLNKFMMLVRRLLRQSIVMLKNHKFKKDYVIKYGEILTTTILNPSKKDALGLFMHFIEIFMEELAKVSVGNLPSDALHEFLVPFITCLGISVDARQISHLKKFIFLYLMKQSDVGLEYEDKYQAWKQLGFPGTIHSMQKVANISDQENSDDEGALSEETLEKPLDPRAGRVDVELPQLRFNPKIVSRLLLQRKYVEGTTVTARDVLTLLSRQFSRLSQRSYPLGITSLKLPKDDIKDMNIRKAVNRLVKFENKLMGKDSRSMKRKLKQSKDDKNAKKRKLENGIEHPSGSDSDVNNVDSEKWETSVIVEKQKSNKMKKAKVLNRDSTLLDKDEKIKRRKEPEEWNIFSVETPLKKKMRKSSDDNVEPESAFERNSGLWLVYNQDDSMNSSLDSSSLDLGNFLESKIENLNDSKNGRKNGITSRNATHSEEITTPNRCRTPEKSSPNEKEKSSENDNAEEGVVETTEQCEKPNKKIKKRISEIKLTGNEETLEIEPVFSTPTKELFPRNPWDEPLEEGEYEICIPSKSYVEKLKKITRKSSLNVQQLINNSLGKACATPSSAKRVKINTKLNMSQEFDEYCSQMISSPVITFDANRKPGKPLLKTPIKNSPVNPFYKQLINF